MTGPDGATGAVLEALISEFGMSATLGDVRATLLRRSVRRGFGLPDCASDDDVGAAFRARLDALNASKEIGQSGK